MRAVAAIVILVAVALTACSDASAGKYGADLFGVTCAHCHGSDLGGVVGPPLGAGSGAVVLTDEQIAGVISVGPGAMPAFADRLTDEQVESLIDYLRERQRP
ncbi:MAG: cytochrome c [Actinomycetota bacterium]|nr:cytochrome c [Actinomycetota bacterium]